MEYTSRDRDAPHPPRRVLKGFSHINRYWDPGQSVYAAKILPGEYYVTIHDEAVVTVLGSCVSACVRDRVFGVGGMNHFMLPSSGMQDGDSWQSSSLSASTRYGNFAMEHLINDILKNGGRRENLELKIFGGGRILQQMTDIGRRNIAFVHDYITTEGLSLTAEDVGDIYPRKVYFFPTSGKVRVKKLRSLHNNTIADRENAYLVTLRTKPVEGEIELF
jgi:chemotaxis protein CheD